MKKISRRSFLAAAGVSAAALALTACGGSSKSTAASTASASSTAASAAAGDAAAAAGIAQLIHQGLAGRVDLIFVVHERLAQAFGVDRLARGEQDGHQGPL